MFFSFTDQDEKEKQHGGDGEEHKPRRKAYVHKPFLYSRYYSDSDDEVTVEERRRSVVSGHMNSRFKTLTIYISKWQQGYYPGRF